jgi:NAD(P)-dependent dehydrogenase (short-subunit alcohol dehydrogenase family)
MDEHPLALVTGAAHRLGHTFALTLARHGYAIILHYHHSAEASAATTKEIRSLNVPVYPMEADLTDPAAIQSMFSQIDSLDHRLKILVNSAGTIKRGLLQTISTSDWDNTLDLNLRAPLLLAQRAAERMSDGSLIVNITEAGVGKVWTGFADYLISKSGLEALTRLQAKTYAPNIRVNAIAPGPVLPSTEITTVEWEKLLNRLPLKHPASLEEISMALEFLIKNGSVTGQTIVVDSGYSLI